MTKRGMESRQKVHNVHIPKLVLLQYCKLNGIKADRIDGGQREGKTNAQKRGV